MIRTQQMQPQQAITPANDIGSLLASIMPLVMLMMVMMMIMPMMKGMGEAFK